MPYQADANAHKGWTLPLAYAPDNLTNIEVGWRSTWRDSRLQWNGTLYQEDWAHAQVEATIPTLGAAAIVNGGTYRVHGIETSASLHVADGLKIDAGASWSRGQLVKEGTFNWDDGTPINFSTLRDANGKPVVNFGGMLGSSLAGAPAFQGNIRTRYEIDVDGLQTFVQIGAVHQSHSLSSTIELSIPTPGNSGAYNLSAFTTFDGAIGVGNGGWSVQAYGENLSDTRAQLFVTYSNYVKAVTVNRPRTIGLRLTYKFGGDRWYSRSDLAAAPSDRQ